jgi:hypothetical protein
MMRFLNVLAAGGRCAWLLSWVFGCAAAAQPDPWNLREQLADPGWAWSQPESFELPGAWLRVQEFSAPLDAERVADRLARLRGGPFVRMQVVGPSLWLSGLDGAAHWLARLRVQAGTTRGQVSSLTPREDPDTGFDALRFAPSGARRILWTSGRDAGRASLTRLECEGDPDGIQAGVARRLREGGWRPEDAQAPRESAARWRHPAGARLSVLSEIHTDRVVLTFWHHAGEAAW